MNNSIFFAGDTLLASKNGIGNIVSDSLRGLFLESDAVCVNLETVLIEGCSGSQKAFNISTPPNNVKFLRENNIGIVNIANNHSCDFGNKGREFTENVLSKENIKIIGASTSNRLFVELGNGITVGLLAYTNFAGEGLEKLCVPSILEDVKQLKEASKCKYVVVNLHWGEEYVAYPRPLQQRIAHSLIEGGVDVIIGHHPHCMQGFEKYKNGIVFYSLGNFNFHVDHPYSESLLETKYAYCVRLYFDENIRYEIIPVFIDTDWVPDILEKETNSKVLNYIEDISKPLERRLSSTFWFTQASVHHFKNNMPAWHMRIKKYGIKHFLQMLVWLIRPGTIKYYFGLLNYPFRDRIELSNYISKQ